MEAIEIIKQATLAGNVLTLPPGQLDRKLYEDVAKKLTGIGGKWNKKANGFLFPHHPGELLEALQGGTVRNLKKEFQSFYTPADVGQFMVCELTLMRGNSERILEPSAGDGALIRALRKEGQTNPVDCYELDTRLHAGLAAMPGVTVVGADFMEARPVPTYDLILANPPFTKGQDIAHIARMYDLLKPGGCMVSCCSTSWKHNSAKKYATFRQWIEDLDAGVFDLDGGRFKESGTNVATCVITIDKSKMLKS
jgi:hypothetical protein